MNIFFEALSSSLQHGIIVAVLASLIWGIASVLLSPCHLSGFPLAITVLSKSQSYSYKKTSFYFGIGIILSMIATGIVVLGIGTIISKATGLSNWIIASSLVLSGLFLLEVLDLPSPSPHFQDKSGRILVVLSGGIFGFVLGPCTLAFVLPLFAGSFSLGSENFNYGLFLFTFFSIGHLLALYLMGASFEIVSKWTHGYSRFIGISKKTIGISLIIFGVFKFYTI